MNNYDIVDVVTCFLLTKGASSNLLEIVLMNY